MLAAVLTVVSRSTEYPAGRTRSSSRDRRPDRVVDELKPYDPQLLETNLSTDNEEKLREEFAADGLRA